MADLPRLEAAILNARKLGAEALEPGAYAAASELRARLQEAARLRSTLDAAVRGLQRSQRPEDADALQRLLQVRRARRVWDAAGAWGGGHLLHAAQHMR